MAGRRLVTDRADGGEGGKSMRPYPRQAVGTPPYFRPIPESNARCLLGLGLGTTASAGPEELSDDDTDQETQNGARARSKIIGHGQDHCGGDQHPQDESEDCQCRAKTAMGFGYTGFQDAQEFINRILAAFALHITAKRIGVKHRQGVL